MTALEPRRETRPPGDRLDHAVVVALGLAACALAAAGLTSQRLGVPAALWVAAGGALPLSLGMLLILHERTRRSRETERIKRRETAAILAEKLAQARRRALEMPPETPQIETFVDDAPEVAHEPSPPEPPAPENPEVVVMPEDPTPHAELRRPSADEVECSSVDRVAQLEETVIDLNRQVLQLQQVIQGAARTARSTRAGRHSGPPEDAPEEGPPADADADSGQEEESA